MPGSLVLSLSTVLGFLLTLVRVGGVFVFVPIPGLNAVLSPARVILVLGITIALFAQWPHVNGAPSAGLFVMWLLVEASLGVGIGLTVGFVTEAFAMGAQLIGLQAGYSFASTVDPSTQADSTVLIVLTQTTTGMLFFAMGLHREIIRVFAYSMETFPAGSFVLSREAALKTVSAASVVFSTGLRLALPLIAVMVMLDISLALLGRVNAQLNLLTIAFPVKMTVGLVLLSWVALLFPVLMRQGIATSMATARGLLVH
jgi:flagellar biosynthetic protein FliR